MDYKTWKKDVYEPFVQKNPERKKTFLSLSGQNVEPLYTQEHIQNKDVQNELGQPGSFPYTRGIYPNMYRQQLWTMRQFAGFGTAKDTNERFHYLINQGQTGLSVAFHMPTIMGYDSDHERSIGEVGKTGVCVDTIDDMETLFSSIALDKITTSMTINAPAIILFCMYLGVAKKRNIPWTKLRGTTQNDILKEYIAQKSWIFPPNPSMRLIVDMIEFASKEVPLWNTISISGYHIREAGSSAVSELAFTLADGIAYVQAGVERGLNVDDFAPRLSFFFNAHNDFFEEIAKYRAARRIWAKVMRDRFGAKNPKSLMCRFHTQTAGCSLTAQQPYNNVVRTTMQALAAVLGGTQSLHTNSLDETLALPTQEAVTLALRTQQIIAHESGVTHTVDPLGGSYYVESKTNEMEEKALTLIKKIDDLGGMIKAIELGFVQREISNEAYRYQNCVESKEEIIVGVNQYVQDNEEPIELHAVSDDVEKTQIQNLKLIKSSRDVSKVKQRLDDLKIAAQGKSNLVPYVYNCVMDYASLGEICDVFRDVFGQYHDPKWL